MESMQLKGIEKAKIDCAKKLFNEVSTSKVRYHEVDSYDNLLKVMEKLQQYRISAFDEAEYRAYREELAAYDDFVASLDMDDQYDFEAALLLCSKRFRR